MAESTQSQVLATALIAIAVSAFSAYLWKRKSRAFEAKIRELESSLKSTSDKCASERQGRIRAQQNLRKTLTQPKFNDSEMTAYPMTPIGTVRSCFSTRNGTPRQPLIVPLARACLVFDTSRVPPASLEGLSEYSHCWIIYVFHLNTNLEKLWRNPRESKFKAKVRVPRLKGERIGVFSTRSPHRPCPVGLTVAKIEAVQGNMILLSGADLVDGTPVLDIKPYLPYCDSVESASVPKWITGENLLAVDSVSFSEGFGPTLIDSWEKVGKHSLYASPEEFQSFIRQVLSWDIRSLSQRNRPHESVTTEVDGDEHSTNASDSDDHGGETASELETKVSPIHSKEVIYKLILEGLDIFYEIDGNGNVIVHKVSRSSAAISNSRQNGCNYSAWREKFI